ncbi:amino acid adenylation domain-containing protein [Catenulispora pinisilvae]|uniref:amino acid adenylation domain-containing protein n=1 Tax=Catenulispora pinisilvae TaxID=2705253 RepID=UPI002B273749|nr:amino acid adenylation domain-containing protein [Catenulispora pinisilvae]
MVSETGTVWDLVAARLAEDPDAVAVGGTADLTYARLGATVADLADRVAAAASPGSLVALEADAPLAGVVAMMAAARAGCALMPVIADSPPHHRDMVAADARPTAVIREAADGGFAVEPLGPGRTDLTGIAYVLYTSGSTGRPKGVLVSQEALVARLAGLARTPGLSAGESMLAMTALSFDISMAEILLPLTVGATVVAAPFGARLDPTVFAAAVSTYKPSVIQATPSFLRLALAAGWEGAPGSRIWCGGEALTPVLARALVPRCAQLWNVYGPTEATIWASAALVRDGDAISLGEALPGTGLCLADPDGRSAPSSAEPGGEGEILIYGAGLADGYLERPELTAQRFRTGMTPDGSVLCYHTGDRGRYRPDGTLEFLGRTDAQVKLRGHRIEPGEIEAVVQECPGVSEATVLVRSADQPDRAHLVAFVVAAAPTTERVIRRWVAERLPSAMRPARIVLMDSLPRTTAGKVDRVLLTAS